MRWKRAWSVVAKQEKLNIY